jgi:uncharacterized membrane protein
MLVPYLTVHAAMEAAYLGAFGPHYAAMVTGLLKDPAAPPNRWLYAVAAYACFFPAAYVLVFREAARGQHSLAACALRGALFGAAVYGIYNFTNMFLVAGYEWKAAARDIAYGCTSCALLGAAGYAMRPRV